LLKLKRALGVSLCTVPGFQKNLQAIVLLFVKAPWFVSLSQVPWDIQAINNTHTEGNAIQATACAVCCYVTREQQSALCCLGPGDENKEKRKFWQNLKS
jgi:hypothetical protein